MYGIISNIYCIMCGYATRAATTTTTSGTIMDTIIWDYYWRSCTTKQMVQVETNLEDVQVFYASILN